MQEGCPVWVVGNCAADAVEGGTGQEGHQNFEQEVDLTVQKQRWRSRNGQVLNQAVPAGTQQRVHESAPCED